MNMQTRSLKIALVGFRLSGGGGSKVMANLSNYFSEKGLDVHIIIFHDEIGYKYTGELYNLGKLKSRSNTFLNKIKRYKALKKYIRQQQFDYIIDFRFRINLLQEVMISKFIYKPKTIYTVHSSHLPTFLPRSKFFANIIYANSFKIVSICKAMTTLINENYSFENVTTIYNPIDPVYTNDKAMESIELDFEYILAVGEYDTNTKQFDKLIEAYAQSELPEKEVSLIILGKGKLKDYLQSKIKMFKLEDKAHLLGYKNNPYQYMKRAKFLIQSSKYEGFPMVLIEALTCGTPVVAFDCPTGPNEIIAHGENGLLVENQNIEKLSNAMNAFMKDATLYENCKNNAAGSAEKFSIDIIGKQWLDLIGVREN